jgi:hypothetical protein
MNMDYPKHSTQPEASAPAQPGHAAARDMAVPASRGPAAQAAITDQLACEAALWEGWRVSAPSHQGRGIAHG